MAGDGDGSEHSSVLSYSFLGKLSKYSRNVLGSSHSIRETGVSFLCVKAVESFVHAVYDSSC